MRSFFSSGFSALSGLSPVAAVPLVIRHRSYGGLDGVKDFPPAAASGIASEFRDLDGLSRVARVLRFVRVVGDRK